MSKKPGFSALHASVEFMSTVYQLASHTHQKMTTFAPRLPCKLDSINFNDEYTCMQLFLSMKIVIVILCRSILSVLVRVSHRWIKVNQITIKSIQIW